MKFNNRILVFTLVAISLIAVYMTVNSYYTQLHLYEDQELFKLDCIANAVAYKIDGAEHDTLISRYPSSSLMGQATSDSAYREIYMQMRMALDMTGIPTEMYTMVENSRDRKFYKAISTDTLQWMKELSDMPPGSDTLFAKGGILGLFETSAGEKMLGAASPVKNSHGQTTGVLRVEKTFEAFIAKARDQIYINIVISLFFIGVVGTFMYFSVKNVLRRQQLLAAERQDLERMRQDLVANVSHDLRTPLASIHGYIETLLMKGDSLGKEQVEKYLNTTLQSTDKLRVLVDELFDLSKLESKERKLNIERFAVDELLSDMASNFRVAAAEKHIEIRTEVPRDLPKVNADLALTDRVLQNLMTNSIKHCKDGEHIYLTAESNGGKVWITVRDTGAGISEEDLPHVFNRFHRGRGTRTGSGLGLAIVKGILDLHGSEYHLQSALNQGTTFRFSLPVA